MHHGWTLILVLSAAAAAEVEAPSTGVRVDPTVSRKLVVVDVDVSGFYSRLPILDPTPALALAYLLRSQDVEVVAVTAGWSTWRSWLQRLFLAHPCRAAERMLNEVGRGKRIPVVCASGAFLESRQEARDLAKVLEGTVSPGGGGVSQSHVVWLALDSMASLTAVLRETPAAARLIGKVLRTLDISPVRPTEAKGYEFWMPPQIEVELAPFLQSSHNLVFKGMQHPDLVLLPRASTAQLDEAALRTMVAGCSGTWIHRYVTMRRFFSKGLHIVTSLLRLTWVERFLAPFGIRIADGPLAHSAALVSAVVSSLASADMEGFLQELCFIVPVRGSGRQAVDEPSRFHSCGMPFKAAALGSGRRDLEVRVAFLHNPDAFTRVAGDILCKVTVGDHSEL